jgi:hypothetical protein
MKTLLALDHRIGELAVGTVGRVSELGCRLDRGAGGFERAGLGGSLAWWSVVVLGFALVALLGRRAGF